MTTPGYWYDTRRRHHTVNYAMRAFALGRYKERIGVRLPLELKSWLTASAAVCGLPRESLAALFLEHAKFEVDTGRWDLVARIQETWPTWRLKHTDEDWAEAHDRAAAALDYLTRRLARSPGV